MNIEEYFYFGVIIGLPILYLILRTVVGRRLLTGGKLAESDDEGWVPAYGVREPCLFSDSDGTLYEKVRWRFVGENSIEVEFRSLKGMGGPLQKSKNIIFTLGENEPRPRDNISSALLPGQTTWDIAETGMITPRFTPSQQSALDKLDVEIAVLKRELKTKNADLPGAVAEDLSTVKRYLMSDGQRGMSGKFRGGM